LHESATKYNNTKLAKRWKKTEDKESKVISALVTEINDLKAMSTNEHKPHAKTTDQNPKPENKKNRPFVPE